jgi:hypothetical protein
MQAERSAFSCFLLGRSENVLLDRPALSSPSVKCQATWLWYFRHCAVSGLPSRAFYSVALKISSSTVLLSHDSCSITKMLGGVVVVLSSLRRYSKWLDSMLACCREKESV